MQLNKIFSLLLLPLLFAGCGENLTGNDLRYTEDEELKQQSMQDYDESGVGSIDSRNLYNREWQEAMPQAGDKVVVLETTAGTIKIKLFPTETPTLATNFATLAAEGKYDNTPFHRVIEGFMIQSGDYENKDGTGGESYTGKGLADEYSTKLRHIRGAVAAAKSSLPNSIGSQFYIVHQDSFFLDEAYSIFGQVYEGMDIVDAIATAPVESNKYGEASSPVDPVYIEKAYTETYSAQ